MTREEKCKIAINIGYTYNIISGKIINKNSKEITAKSKNGYIVIHIWCKITKRQYNLQGHQFAWYIINNECVEQIDHINGIRDDNRLCNLRSVTHQENHFNETKAKGYSWFKRDNNWRAQIMINNKNIHLGYFNLEEDARAAYIEAKEKYHIIK